MPTAGRPALRTGEFVPLVALQMALVAFLIDAILPALPAIGSDLSAAQRNDAQVVIAALLLGLGFGQVLFGPRSDSIGREPAICAELWLFMADCVLSVLASNCAGQSPVAMLWAWPRLIEALVLNSTSGSRRLRMECGSKQTQAREYAGCWMRMWLSSARTTMAGIEGSSDSVEPAAMAISSGT
ncbi:MAG: hypothetical protein OXI81_08940 [Paracoccaceae bacterium]|nr:hypothetical protein [Paracoccaceae bacterium]